jgi:glycosyltransferase involved in cell wall biosynthesis
MGGIGVRYVEMAAHLAARGREVSLSSPAPAEEAAAVVASGVRYATYDGTNRLELLEGMDAVVVQGQLANDVVLAPGKRPVAIDLYDPFLIEHLSYLPALGLDPYRNDHASWVLQLGRGDFFLCSSEEQRLFYLGFLAALGRVNPELARDDVDARGLIDVVPFGLPSEPPPHRPYLPPPPPGVRRLLFGAIYDWYDPWTLLDALATLDDVDWRLLVIRRPGGDETPQELFARLEARARSRGWWGSRVESIDWVPYERRFDLLRDVELMVAPHRPTLETALSLRTRFLEALAVGCPVLATAGGALGRLLVERDAGVVVPPGDAGALAAALREALGDAAASRRRVENGRALAREFRTERALAPLERFLDSPRVEPSKDRFAFRPATVAPDDSLLFRLRRKARRLRSKAAPK